VLKDVSGVAGQDAVGRVTPRPVQVDRVHSRPLSWALKAILGALIVAAAAGYWWLNRPPGRYKADNSGLYLIKVNGKYGFMDRSGKTVIAPQFDSANGFSEGLAQVRVGNKSGYIDTKGGIVITPQFDDALQFQYGRAGVKLCCGSFHLANAGDRYGFINKEGKYITTPDFLWVGSFSGNLAPVKTAAGVVAFVNQSGKVELSGKFENLSEVGFTEGLAAASSGGKWGFIDATGKWAIDPQFETVGYFADGLAPVRVGDQTGYIDKVGRFVVNPQFSVQSYEFSEGYAVVGMYFQTGPQSRTHKVDYIDTKGRILADWKFQAVGNFSDGRAPVKTENGWGFIDRTGKIVIKPHFDSADVFQNGLAHVWVGDKEAFVTTSGAYVADPFQGQTVISFAERLGVSTYPGATVSVGKGAIHSRGIDQVQYTTTESLDKVVAFYKNELGSAATEYDHQDGSVLFEFLRSGCLNHVEVSSDTTVGKTKFSISSMCTKSR
jgi:hypothetical protein